VKLSVWLSLQTENGQSDFTDNLSPVHFLQHCKVVLTVSGAINHYGNSSYYGTCS